MLTDLIVIYHSRWEFHTKKDQAKDNTTNIYFPDVWKNTINIETM